jgi:hypothetical protein
MKVESTHRVSPIISQQPVSAASSSGVEKPPEARAQRSCTNALREAAKDECNQAVGALACLPVCATGAAAGGLYAAGWTGVNLVGASSSVCVTSTAVSLGCLVRGFFGELQVQP